jgi:uncharacterized protein YgiB involved in biofilm formation
MAKGEYQPGDSMKRSKTASLMVMGLTPLFISACDDTNKSQQEFVSVDACTGTGVPAASCQNAYNQALAESYRWAPHYSNEAQCAADYEQNTCVEDTDPKGNVYWNPVMNAFLIARVVRDGQTLYYPAGPIFRKRDLSDYSPRYGTFGGGSGGGGGHVSSGGWYSVPSEEVAGEGDTASRGGFGGGEGEGGHGE